MYAMVLFRGQVSGLEAGVWGQASGGGRSDPAKKQGSVRDERMQSSATRCSPSCRRERRRAAGLCGLYIMSAAMRARIRATYGRPARRTSARRSRGTTDHGTAEPRHGGAVVNSVHGDVVQLLRNTLHSCTIISRPVHSSHHMN